jgi:branched-chain amino acid transport system substrate-binding protein
VQAGTLTIYTSLPFEGPYAVDARYIFDAEQLALSQAGGAVNGLKVVLRRLDDASPVTKRWDPARVAANARTAAGDLSTIAYIGELTPGSSGDSIPVLSSAGILQVSPGDTATNLAGATFARVVPPASAEALAQLAAMEKKGVKRLYLLEDRTTFGADIAAAAIAHAAAYGITVVDPSGKYLDGDTRSLVRAIKRSKAGGLLYAGGPAADVAAFWNALSATDTTIKKFASAAITDAASWPAANLAARYNTFLSAPGLPRLVLPRAGTQFVSDFLATYGSHVSPDVVGGTWTSAIFGYVAMSGVLEALYGLGPHARDPRARVATAYLATKRLPSALGAYSIVNGQTTFQRYLFTRYDKVGHPAPYTP